MVSSDQLKGVDNLATTKNITMKQFNGADYDTLYPKTKVEQVEGAYTQQQILADSTKRLYGLGNDAVPDDAFVALTNCFAQILVTTRPNIEVTASLNGKTVRATSDSSGLAILKIPGFGTWTVSAIISGASISVNYEIKAIAQYELNLSTNLETAGWDVIDSISKSGNAASIWSVGDKKTVAIDGVNYKVQIIGFNHDTKTSGGKAGITFQMVDCMNDTAYMNSSKTNSTGWKNCTMRTSTMNSLFSKLPTDLQNAIKAVNKLTSAGNKSSAIVTVSDKLFLLSEVEISGSKDISFAGEGSQYDWYKAGNTKIKKVNGSANYWWERSPYRGNTTAFCTIDSSGAKSYNTADAPLGLSFAFCV